MEQFFFPRATCASSDLYSIPYTLYRRLRPESVSIYPQYHPRRACIVPARILCSYPFSEYAILSARACVCMHVCVQMPTWTPTCSRVFVRGSRREERGCTTVLTSVQGGTWPLAVGATGRDEGVIRVERTCLLSSTSFLPPALFFSVSPRHCLCPPASFLPGN